MVAPVKLVEPVFENGEWLAVLEAVQRREITYRAAPHQRFERALTDYLGKPTLACSSGTAALHLALLALNIGRGHEVIVPDLTFGTAASVVLAVGATPIFADVDPDTMCMTDETVDRVKTSRTMAILKTHLYGNRCKIRRDFAPVLIEDSCEAFGIIEPDATFTCYSFYANKPITTGEGGAICGKNLESVLRYRNGSFTDEYEFELPGLNYRMTSMQAALGCAQLENSANLIGRRIKNAERYAKHLRGTGKWMFCVETDDPKRLQEELKLSLINSRRVFMPLHLHPPFRQAGDFSGAMEAWNKYLALPTGPHLTEDQQDYVIEVINGARHLQRSANIGGELAKTLGPERLYT